MPDAPALALVPELAFMPAEPAAPVLSLAPFVMPGLLSGGECASLIALFEARNAGRTRLTGGLAETGIRSSNGLWIDDADAPWLVGRLAGFAAATCRQAFPFDIDGFEEGYHLLRYDAPSGIAPEGDFYDWHVDIGGHGSARSRKLTLIIQLSDSAAYTGGTLELNATGDAEILPAEQGMGLAFPAFMPHRVSPVKSGVRYSLVAWLHGPAFR